MLHLMIILIRLLVIALCISIIVASKHCFTHKAIEFSLSLLVRFGSWYVTSILILMISISNNLSRARFIIPSL